ncbi:MAG: hypothetical protein PWQ88_824 [Candidatus Methanomethylophilaceae archaeon]|nr:hypothetical protein [Candidatus Methanomethylophilaceae archaeon]HIJ00605.1 hypothetical protein [Candidatus Methanomethylophilaceae archaeon]
MILLIGIIVAGVFLTYSPIIESANVNMHMEDGEIVLDIYAGYSSKDIHILMFEGSEEWKKVEEVIIFSDISNSYPFITKKAVADFTMNMQNTMRIMGSNVNVLSVGFEDLFSVIEDVDDAKGKALIVLTGILPSTVFNGSDGVLIDWISAGGTMLWFGSPLGNYQGGSSAINDSIKFQLSAWGTSGLVYNGQPGETASSPGPKAELIGHQYNHISNGLYVAEVETLGGVSLGWEESGITSLAVLPLGEGYVFVFGGEMTRGKTSMNAAAHMLSAPWGAMDITFSESVHLEGKETHEMTLLPEAPRVFVYVFDSCPMPTFGQSQMFLLAQ